MGVSINIAYGLASRTPSFLQVACTHVLDRTSACVHTVIDGHEIRYLTHQENSRRAGAMSCCSSQTLDWVNGVC